MMQITKERVTESDRSELAMELEHLILKHIDQAGYRNGAAAVAVYGAVRLVVDAVKERKEVQG